MLVQLALRLLPLLALGAQDGYVKSFESAWKAVESGDLSTARARYTACLDVRPHSAACEYHLACLSAREGKKAEAIRWLDAAVDDGFEDENVAKWEPDLARLRENDDFETLLGRMQANGSKFQASTAVQRAEYETTLSLDMPEFSPDGQRLLSDWQTTLSVIDVTSGELIASQRFPYEQRCLEREYSPDGRTIATLHADGSVKLFDGNSGAFRCTVDGPAYSNRRLIFASDSTRLASGDRVWNTLTGEHAAPWTDRLHDWETSPDGELAIELSAKDGTVEIHETQHGTSLVVLRDPSVKMYSAHFAGSEPLVITVGEHRLSWWNGRTGERLPISRQLDCWHESLTVSPDHNRALLAYYGESKHELEMIDASSGQALWKLSDPTLDFGGAFTVDSATVAISRGWQALEIHDVATGLLTRTIRRSSLLVREAAVHPNSKRMAVPCDDGSVRELDVASGALLQQRRIDGHAVNHALYNGDGSKLAVACEDGTVALWSSTNPQQPARMWRSEGCGDTPQLAFDGNGQLLFGWATKSGRARWQSETDATPRDVALDSERIDQIVFSNDASLIAALGQHGQTRAFRTSNAEPFGDVLEQSTSVNCAAFSPDNRYLVTGADDGTARIWDPMSGTIEHTLPHKGMFEPPQVWAVVYSPDGTSIATGVGEVNGVTCWDAATGKQRWTFDLGVDCAGCATGFDASGRWLLWSGNSAVFDAANGKRLAELADCNHGYPQATPDRRFIVSPSWFATVAFNASNFKTRYKRSEFTDGGFLLRVPSLHCNATAVALRESLLTFDGITAPVDCFAEQLFDPRKVAASLAGVAVATPRLAQPPVIELMPRDRVRKLAGEAISIAASATDPLGLAGFEVERDGGFVDPKLVQAATKIGDDGTRAELALSLPHSADAREIEFEVRALSKSGVLSRPARVTFRAKP
jgi:WD40 repeat protein